MAGSFQMTRSLSSGTASARSSKAYFILTKIKIAFSTIVTINLVGTGNTSLTEMTKARTCCSTEAPLDREIGPIKEAMLN